MRLVRHLQRGPSRSAHVAQSVTRRGRRPPRLLCDAERLARSERRRVVGHSRAVFSPALWGAVEDAPHGPHEVDMASFTLSVRNEEQLAGPQVADLSVAANEDRSHWELRTVLAFGQVVPVVGAVFGREKPDGLPPSTLAVLTETLDGSFGRYGKVDPVRHVRSLPRDGVDNRGARGAWTADRVSRAVGDEHEAVEKERVLLGGEEVG